MKILVAEDEPFMLKTLQLKLSKEGYEVIGCNDGLTALQKIKAILPDLVITDMRLPQFSGLQLISAVKAIVQKNIPVVVVSALTQSEVIDDAIEKGASDYITKPFSLAELAARIKRLLHRS